MKTEKYKPHVYYPCLDDEGWNREVEKLMPYCWGQGIDVGSGGRSPVPGQVRADCDRDRKPDIIVDSFKLPVKDNEFDYLTNLHVLEHFDDTGKVIREWLRVVKPGGYVLCVLPDKDYTPKHDQRHAPPEGVDAMWHYRMWNLAEFQNYLKENKNFGARMLDIGPALYDWSFYAILQKI